MNTKLILAGAISAMLTSSFAFADVTSSSTVTIPEASATAESPTVPMGSISGDDQKAKDSASTTTTTTDSTTTIDSTNTDATTNVDSTLKDNDMLSYTKKPPIERQPYQPSKSKG